MKLLKRIFFRGYLLQKVCHGRYRIKVTRFFESYEVGYLDLHHPKDTWGRENEHYATRCVGTHLECASAIAELQMKEEKEIE